jgi:NADH-quinone oxidoreductase subunit A
MAGAAATGQALAHRVAPVTRIMGYDLTNVFVFVVFSALFVIVAVSVMSRILRPRARPADEPAKMETYECGEPAIGSSWVRFDIRFYTVALIFIIFDVEVAFLYPWGVVYEDLRHAGLGAFVFIEMLVFLGILVVGFVYCWAKGDLDWVKGSEGQAQRRAATTSAAPPPTLPPVTDGAGREAVSGAKR